ncbi:unnamed protein product (macronuclear) [Paramecium tetraurelia]|uniref:Uncharacterized protein n=1 Tax=Paramecium tetraurelia TaxID=5888 RepID=A0C1V0_PARTE|nr:uncharacterized protein GSPATT00034244001 [Paramecium tetraurelia]CAK64767.1 unnamed protein product [Paramecium tetraurelia]|eukprot:XP_001432164.1 hypothetical protein (macronuclear) [Paramecium tetraurelia strain d4-2]
MAQKYDHYDLRKQQCQPVFELCEQNIGSNLFRNNFQISLKGTDGIQIKKSLKKLTLLIETDICAQHIEQSQDENSTTHNIITLQLLIRRISKRIVDVLEVQQIVLASRIIQISQIIFRHTKWVEVYLFWKLVDAQSMLCISQDKKFNYYSDIQLFQAQISHRMQRSTFIVWISFQVMDSELQDLKLILQKLHPAENKKLSPRIIFKSLKCNKCRHVNSNKVTLLLAIKCEHGCYCVAEGQIKQDNDTRQRYSQKIQKNLKQASILPDVNFLEIIIQVVVIFQQLIRELLYKLEQLVMIQEKLHLEHHLMKNHSTQSLAYNSSEAILINITKHNYKILNWFSHTVVPLQISFIILCPSSYTHILIDIATSKLNNEYCDCVQIQQTFSECYIIGS